jgi:23S rRNA (uracil1939-C5)-methyltransferase
VVLGEEIRLLAGRETLLEKIGDLKFRISATSFFQVHTRQVPAMWGLLKGARDWRGDEKILELYCGVGTLSLPLARLAPRGSLWGVESSNRSVADAQENASLNEISNARFNSAQSVEGFAWMKEEGIVPDLLVADPPRAGLEKEVLAALMELKPAEIVYVSCDPATLARDLGELVNKGGYALQSVAPLDLFPQTAHVEAVAYLKHP